MSRLPIAALASCASALALSAAATTYNPRLVQQTVSTFDVATDSFAAPGSTDGVSFVATPIDIQLGGTATAMAAVVERSPTDPAVTASWATVDSYSAAPAAIGLKAYQEAGIGWWRVRVTSLTGGTVTIAITGRRG